MLVTVLAFGTLPSIILGVIISLGILVYRVSFPQIPELGRDRQRGHSRAALEKLRTSGVLETLGEDKVFLHVEQATETAQSRGNGS